MGSPSIIDVHPLWPSALQVAAFNRLGTRSPRDLVHVEGTCRGQRALPGGSRVGDAVEVLAGLANARVRPASAGRWLGNAGLSRAKTWVALEQCIPRWWDRLQGS